MTPYRQSAEMPPDAESEPEFLGRGLLIRKTVSPPHACRPPGYIARWGMNLRDGDRWICECRAVHQWDPSFLGFGWWLHKYMGAADQDWFRKHTKDVDWSGFDAEEGPRQP